MMTVSEILNHVEVLSPNAQYWFVRTDNGKWFDEFLKYGYIAVGWDYITLHEINNSKEEYIRNKIAKAEKIDNSDFRGKMKISFIYNKLRQFSSLKRDDVVVIPSVKSNRLAFGRIADDMAFEDVEAKSFRKRRKVDWYEVKDIGDLNPVFYQVKSNQHTISNIDDYSSYIDRVIGSLFRKGDDTHYVLHIEQEQDINFDDLRVLMDNIKELNEKINKFFAFEENLDTFAVKVNLQSKGSLELIKGKSKTLAVLAYCMYLASCNVNDGDNDTLKHRTSDIEIRDFSRQNQDLLDSTSKIIDSLKINMSSMTKSFENGN